MKRGKRLLITGAVIFVLIGVAVGIAVTMNYAWFAVQFAPAKKPAGTRSAAAQRAEKLMWDVLHAGQYDKIPEVLTALTAAYLENPTDPTTASHVGFMHMWRLAEGIRMPVSSPTVTDHAVLARKYFQEAVRLNPSDARYLGFLGSATLAEGSIHADEKTIRRGYYTLQDSIKAWPEFNLFTAGYSLSRRPAGSPQYKEALERQWQNADMCAKRKVDRKDPDFSKYSATGMSEIEKRACWNTWKAPHNFEGFFLNLGDMVVKTGDWQTGQKIYANARLSPDYAGWNFKAVLDERIKNAQANVALFNEPIRQGDKRQTRMMISSAFACVGCHQH